MVELEETMEEMMRRLRLRDTIAAIAISSAFITFGILILVLMDVIFVPLALRTFTAVVLLFLAWIFMIVGIYLLTTLPMPKKSKLVADSYGVEKLVEKGYRGRVYISAETFKRLPSDAVLKIDLKVIDVNGKEAEKYKKYGEELSHTIVLAKRLKAKIVSSKKGKIEGVEVVTVDDVY
ncbi:MAG: hypothetical protein NZ895_05310 [Archaeoglobaceae archaeon]|nr:hypothetical protein [Archaeoglobaceae archaeon]MCX8151515.1 hypothetical protein [Archaeoglobaceae archaeon]MDW8013249.1 hypothetical protein [Archaeoglobaceae archaeon]